MKYEIPEEEKSKLRLFKELPKGLRGGAAHIRDSSLSWEEAKASITELITMEIKDLMAIRTLLNCTQPVGAQRKTTCRYHRKEGATNE